jgi:hypothetical protein
LYEPRTDAPFRWNENSPHRPFGSDARAQFGYGVYGISLRSEFRLSLPAPSLVPLLEVELSVGCGALFLEAIRGTELLKRSNWYEYANRDDGSSYVRWSGIGEFLVSSDGRRIACGRESTATMESFQVYLLGQALSFALVKSGFEPLHATVVTVNDEAVAFLGESGAGKSTLATCFLADGHSMLTDDLLVLQQSADGFVAYPGPPRIKLLPDVAEYLLGGTAVGVRMNPDTTKLILPLGPAQWSSSPKPLRAIYVLEPPNENNRTERPQIEPLSRRAAFMALVRNAFNYVVVDAHRLERQLTKMTSLAMAMPIKRLQYPRGLDCFPFLREAILSDLKNAGRGKGQDRTL